MDSAFQKALANHPFDTFLRLEYALHLLGQGSFPEALSQFRLLKQQNSSLAIAHLGEAHLLLLLGEEAEARGARERAEACFDFPIARHIPFALAPSQPAKGAPHLRAVDALPPFLQKEAPSHGRSEAAPPPGKVTFADVVGMDDVKKILRVKIVEPFLRPGLFERFGKSAGGGVLLYGPPGCGKTLFAKAVATECAARLVSVSISDVLSKWIGESEARIADAFQQARSAQPCVLFFDEIDSLGFSRARMHGENLRGMVNELLTQLDGLGKDNRGVLVLAATNMPWDVDLALRRPGRFSRFLFVPPPDRVARESMFRRKLDGIPCARLSFGALAAATEHFSGADIDGVIERAKEEILARAFEHSEGQGGDDLLLTQEVLEASCRDSHPSTLDWLKTARNLVRLGGAAHGYADLEKYLRSIRFV